MITVGLKVLKNKLSQYIRLAANGETVLVTDRGKVVAEINPAQPIQDRYIDHPVLALGVREGWVTPAENPGARRRRRDRFQELLSSS